MDSRIDNFRSEAQYSFQGLESNVQSYIGEIEDYVTGIYADRQLLEDFQCFFGNTPEEYQTQRLTKSGVGSELVSFIDNIRAFATKGNRRLFSHISFHPLNPEESINVIIFNNETSTIRHIVPNNDALFAQELDRSIVYIRKLVSPSDLSEPYGEIRFYLRSDWLFSGLSRSVFENAVITDSDSFFTIKGSGEQAQAIYRHSTNGKRNTGLLGGTQVESFASDFFNYRMTVTVSTWALLASNNVIFFVVIGTLLLFLCMMVLIAMTMRQDARFLFRIIRTINYAKNGEFQKIDTPAHKSHNEYGLIASELNDMCGQLERHIQTEYVLKLRQKETEMVALQNQINPHFLYNTLEIIRSMAVVKHADEVADAVSKLGRMYRDIVKSDPIIPLGKELELLTNYLAIMEFRSNGNFYYQVNMDQELRELDTVKFWMQPLAENFFKHGYDKDEEFNLILVNGRNEEGQYLIEFTDNGKRIEEEKLQEINAELTGEEDMPAGNIGLKNVYYRLRNFYGDAFDMEIVNNDESGISIVIRILKDHRGDKNDL